MFTLKTMTRFLPAASALATTLLLSNCRQVAPTPQMPPGIVRGADGTLYYDPNARGTSAPGAPAAPGAPPDVISYWEGGTGNGPARIRISRAEQTAYFYRGDQLIGKSWLSTGDVNHTTPAGRFSVLQKDKYHKSSRYGAAVDAAGNVVDADVDIKNDKLPPGTQYEGAKMTNFMRLTPDGIGMHAGFLPGYPASHGCIRMPEHMSEIFFDNVQPGTPVTIE
jgi:lipoprotein-anchoring transpeptidase ErfK/SrfK